MRTVYLGTSDFAAEVLITLAQSPHRPVLVVTRPDRPRGRGRSLASPPVAEAARGLGLEVFQPSSVNDNAAVQQIADAQPDVMVVCAFGALIKEPLLSGYEILNVHPSLLPRWRGAAPIERAIMAGDTTTGVAIMRLEAGLDTGPICRSEQEPIGSRETYADVSLRLARTGARLLVEALDLLPDRLDFTPQPPSGITYAEKISAEDRLLDPQRPAVELDRQIRALNPHIGAALILDDGERLGVWEALPQPGATGGDPAPGELRLDGGQPVLGCRPGTLTLVTVQPPGRKAMAGDAWLRGRRR